MGNAPGTHPLPPLQFRLRRPARPGRDRPRVPTSDGRSLARRPAPGPAVASPTGEVTGFYHFLTPTRTLLDREGGAPDPFIRLRSWALACGVRVKDKQTTSALSFRNLMRAPWGHRWEDDPDSALKAPPTGSHLSAACPLPESQLQATGAGLPGLGRRVTPSGLGSWESQAFSPGWAQPGSRGSLCAVPGRACQPAALGLARTGGTWGLLGGVRGPSGTFPLGLFAAVCVQ